MVVDTSSVKDSMSPRESMEVDSAQTSPIKADQAPTIESLANSESAIKNVNINDKIVTSKHKNGINISGITKINGLVNGVVTNGIDVNCNGTSHLINNELQPNNLINPSHDCDKDKHEENENNNENMSSHVIGSESMSSRQVELPNCNNRSLEIVPAYRDANSTLLVSSNQLVYNHQMSPVLNTISNVALLPNAIQPAPGRFFPPLTLTKNNGFNNLCPTPRPPINITTVKPMSLPPLPPQLNPITPYNIRPPSLHRPTSVYPSNRDLFLPISDSNIPKFPSTEVIPKALSTLSAIPPPYFTDIGNGVLLPSTLTSTVPVPVPGFVYGVPSNATCYVQPNQHQLQHYLQPVNNFDTNSQPTQQSVLSPTTTHNTDLQAIRDSLQTVPPGTIMAYSTVPPTTVSMPAPLSPSASMELVWHGEFDRLFSQYMPHVWYLLPTFYPPSDSWQVFKDSAKVRFSCQCGHGWTSMKGRVIYWFHLNYATSSGYVLFKLYGQECIKCKTGNYEHAMWYPEEVIKVIGNVYNRVGQLFYGFVRPPLRIDRRQGKPRNQHNTTLCQACKEGLCREEWAFS